MLMKLVTVGLCLVLLGRESLGIKFEAGSGDDSPRLETDDEDLTDGGSGDGSGSGDGNNKVTTTVPLTTKSLTPCEQLRKSAQNISMYPKCTHSGEFEPLQCHINLKECWCVDKMGREITGSRMMQPKVPDCVTGSGLKPCVFQLLRSKYSLLGRFEPHCTFDGDYEKIQCLGSACWCVDEEGIEQWGTKVYKPAVPRCPEPTPEPTRAPETEGPVKVTELPLGTKRPHGHKPNNKKDEKPFIQIDDEKEDTSKPDDDFGKMDQDDKGRYDINTNNDKDTGINDAEQAGQRKEKSPIVHIMTQPGLLAAVIGGAVVGLLCVILMVMFIVYRMRKKDEGSYPLEEQKYTNYSYMKAPDKEFYA